MMNGFAIVVLLINSDCILPSVSGSLSVDLKKKELNRGRSKECQSIYLSAWMQNEDDVII